MVAFGLPATLVIYWVLRRWLAAVLFAHVPDAGPFRVHSLRVLAQRRPPVVQTLVGWSLGYGSHLLVEALTHEPRWGAPWLGLGKLAMVLQFAGHTAGSLVGLALLVLVGSRRKLDEWYGDDAVEQARSSSITRRSASCSGPVLSPSAAPPDWSGSPPALGGQAYSSALP